MPNIILNGKVLSFDTILYIDNAIGNDTTGNGSKETPYKTLTKAHQFHSGNTAYILGEGIYNAIYLDDAKYTNSNMTYIGKGVYTTLSLSGSLTNPNGVTAFTNFGMNFYDLIWDANFIGGGYNYIPYNGILNFYNIVFHRIPDTTLGYFCPNSADCSLYMYNCLKTATSSDFIRADLGISELHYCYGAFTSGYGSDISTIDKVNNVITSSPKFDENYRITEDTIYDVGVYYGQYKWAVYTVKAILDKNYINSKNDKISLTITDITPLTDIDTSSFKVLLNNDTIYSNPITLSFPQKINLSFTEVSELLNSNSLYIILNTSTVNTLNLYYEGDGLLNPITRDFKNTDWIDKSNVALNPRTGLSLTNQNRQGNVFTDISVYKKAEVKKVTVDGDNDKIITGNYTFKPNYIEDYFFKNVITRSPGSKFTTMNYMKDNLLYMKSPVEYPNNINFTDDSDLSFNGIGAGGTVTFLLESADIDYLYLKYKQQYFRVDMYDKDNNKIYTATSGGYATTETTFGVFISGVSKIVLYSISVQSGFALYTVKAIGYDGKRAHIFSNPKYINSIYKTRLLVEDAVSITKDLVKSKKMGNLSYVNNNTRAVVKKSLYVYEKTSSKIVRNKIDLTNIPMRKIEVK